jgi:hypothetical protein
MPVCLICAMEWDSCDCYGAEEEADDLRTLGSASGRPRRFERRRDAHQRMIGWWGTVPTDRERRPFP